MSADAAMRAVVSQLETYYGQVASSVAWNVYAPTQHDSVKQGLYVARAGIDFLKGEARDQVLAGSRELRVWLELAGDFARHLGELGRFAVDSSFTSILADSGAAAAEGVAELGRGVSSALPWVALGLVAVAAIWLLPRGVRA